MVDKDGCNSSLRAIRVLRVSLVDDLEGRVDSLIEILLNQDVFTRNDREEVLCQSGPRARVRKVLDILECKGEEAAKTFFSIITHHEQEVQQTHSKESNTHQSKGRRFNPSRCHCYIEDYYQKALS